MYMHVYELARRCIFIPNKFIMKFDHYLNSNSVLHDIDLTVHASVLAMIGCMIELNSYHSISHALNVQAVQLHEPRLSFKFNASYISRALAPQLQFASSHVSHIRSFRIKCVVEIQSHDITKNGRPGRDRL